MKRRERRKLAHIRVSEAALLGFRIRFVKKGATEIFVCLVCFNYWSCYRERDFQPVQCAECEYHANPKRGSFKLLSDRRWENKKRLEKMGIDVKGDL